MWIKTNLLFIALMTCFWKMRQNGANIDKNKVENANFDHKMAMVASLKSYFDVEKQQQSWDEK